MTAASADPQTSMADDQTARHTAFIGKSIWMCVSFFMVLYSPNIWMRSDLSADYVYSVSCE